MKQFYIIVQKRQPAAAMNGTPQEETMYGKTKNHINVTLHSSGIHSFANFSTTSQSICPGFIAFVRCLNNNKLAGQ